MQLEYIVIICVAPILGIGLIYLGYVLCRRRCVDYEEVPAGRYWLFHPDDQKVVVTQPRSPRPSTIAESATVQFIRLAANFCRSSKSERTLLRGLEGCASRANKFFALIQDEEANRDLPVKTPMMLSVIVVESTLKDAAVIDLNPVPESGNFSAPPITFDLARNTKAWPVFRKILSNLQHRYLLPTLEVSLREVPLSKNRSPTPQCAVFLLRPFCPRGSLRDLLHKVDAENGGSHPQRYAKEGGTPLEPHIIAKYGRQILEVLKYFRDIRYPYFHLNSSNVMIDDDGDCRVSDYETGLLGYPQRLYKKMKRFQLPSSPDVVSFGFLLFELATGATVGTSISSFVLPPEYQPVLSILRRIFKLSEDKASEGEGPVSLEELLAHPFFQVFIPPQDGVGLMDPRLQEVLAHVHHYWTQFYATPPPPPSQNTKPKAKRKNSRRPSKPSVSLTAAVDKAYSSDSAAYVDRRPSTVAPSYDIAQLTKTASVDHLMADDEDDDDE